jgi:hypothetical protein
MELEHGSRDQADTDTEELAKEPAGVGARSDYEVASERTGRVTSTGKTLPPENRTADQSSETHGSLR